MTDSHLPLRPPPITTPLPTPTSIAVLLPPAEGPSANPSLPPPPSSIAARNPPGDLADLAEPQAFETLSQALTANLERLATWYEGSGMPYSGRKAGTLRREERRVGELVEELRGLQRTGNEVEEDQEVDWMGVAEELADYSPGVAVDGAEREMAEVQAVGQETEKTDMHGPTPPPSENSEQPGPVKDVAIPTPIVSLPDSHWATLAARDIATVSRLVVAANMLRLTLPDVADAVEAFGLRVCGQRAWGDRVRYYEGYQLGGSVEFAKALLGEVGGMLGGGDGDELGGIIGLL
ncbi:hypothetical protein LTR12_005462 [Friedmanniomyces endolithicus]|nr:hypothetical protein LTR12_005462 [Friedmanniomyces endolithicus]